MPVNDHCPVVPDLDFCDEPPEFYCQVDKVMVMLGCDPYCMQGDGVMSSEDESISFSDTVKLDPVELTGDYQLIAVMEDGSIAKFTPSLMSANVVCLDGYLYLVDDFSSTIIKREHLVLDYAPDYMAGGSHVSHSGQQAIKINNFPISGLPPLLGI